MKTEKMDQAKKVLEEITKMVEKAIAENENLTWDAPVLKAYSQAPYNCIWNNTYKGLLNQLLLSFIGMQYGDNRFVACSWIQRNRKNGVYPAKGSRWHWILKPIKVPTVDIAKAMARGLDPDKIKGELKRDPRGTLSRYDREIFYFILIGFDTIPVMNVRETTGILDKMKDCNGKLIKANRDDRDESDKPKGGFPLLEKIVEKVGAEVKETNEVIPYYAPMSDYIGMPKAERFGNEFLLNESLAHELIHWTGHKSRCDRGIESNTSKQDYSKEELVACLGSSLLLTLLGIDMSQHEQKRQSAYLKNWLKPLQNDPSMLMEASIEAERAVNFLLKESGMKDTLTPKEIEVEKETVEV